MKAVGGSCVICGRAFLATDTVCREVTGWERIRGQGGANAVARRRETGRLAHRTCIDLPPGRMEGQLDLTGAPS